MDSLDDSENNAKISDSAYSNSCSNSQSRRSHSSKSTHSGSHSSGSSGYGGKPSISGSSNTLGQAPEKSSKEKELKKKKSSQENITVEPLVEVEIRPLETEIKEADKNLETTEIDAVQSPGTTHIQVADTQVENMDIVTSESSFGKDEEEPVTNTTLVINSQLIPCTTSKPIFTACSDGFSCVVSMHDGVVMYTTSSITNALGFPKDMWIGRSFIDFVHPKDYNTFASQIMRGVPMPNTVRTQPVHKTLLTMCCRIRTYRGLTTGFATKKQIVTFLPFVLNLSFKDIPHEEGKAVYLVIQATPLYTAFKVPNEVVAKPTPFITRHVANGKIEYIDPESVPYLGYLPQDLLEKDAIQLYHPDDLNYLLQIYEKIMRETKTGRSRAYRMLAQNGDYVKLETEFSCFVNPWSKKLEFICGKHYVMEGPSNPDVFKTVDIERAPKISEDTKTRIQSLRDGIVKIMSEMATKTTELAKQQTSKRCMEIAAFMEKLLEEQPKQMDELKLEIHEPDHSYFERDSVMLGGISPHHENDSKSSTGTPLSYNQLNYNETLQRYFDSYQPCTYEEYRTVNGDNVLGDQIMSKQSAPQMGVISVNMMGTVNPVETCEKGDRRLQRLLESLLIKHNSEMEKELVKKHKEARPYAKVVREMTIKENRQKKKDHLARCNAPYQPTSAEAAFSADEQAHGVKRQFCESDLDTTSHKHHCSWNHRERHRMTDENNVQSKPTFTDDKPAGIQWAGPSTSGLNHFHACGITQQMSVMRPVAAVQVPYVMYPPTAVFSTPFMYSSIGAEVPSSSVHPYMSTNMQFHNKQHPLELTSSNYEEACKPSLALKLTQRGISRREKKPFDSQGTSSSRAIRGSGITSICSSSLTSNRLSFEQIVNRNSDSMRISPESLQDFGDNSSNMLSFDKTSGNDSSDGNNKIIKVARSKSRSPEGGADKTDGESSYSSFCSSFFITEYGSTEESDGKNKKQVPQRGGDFINYRDKKIAKRKGPPWMEKVSVTSELIYKYQMTSRTKDEILKADKQRMNNLEQPYLVNEQLSQLYLELQVEGAPSHLTLEEGITSSGSSGEETMGKLLTPKRPVVKNTRRKREYSRLVMIYEEDAPLPPPTSELMAPISIEQMDSSEATTSKANT